ncbi:MAG: LLM class F420-dependent oxidoreductase [Deltaproteobacteria bacterium]|nr:LLM class F420-dependent oxidoreductase [Deltaproteobacteria bacterium]
MLKATAGMGADVKLRDVATHAQRVESLGYETLSVAEAVHDGMLSSMAALGATTRLRVGQGVLVAFARSPMLAAQGAWDLQEYSSGRFQLGLGTQVKGNIVGRFGMPWSAPAARLRDYVGAVRACFDTFQNGTRLDYESESYTLNRLQPFFNPGPLDCGPPPIMLGAVGPLMTRTVGEVGDALQTHPTNSEARYLREVTRPRLEEGTRKAGRDVRIELVAGPLIATGSTREEVETEVQAARESLVFTLSTPAYWPALEYHGWLDVGKKLRDYTREGKWAEMNGLVTDEILKTFVPAGTYDEIADILLSEYEGVAERILFPVPKDPKNDDAARKVISQLQGG